jgi:tetratricopeptide (TPR) repeat protein
VNRRPPRRVVVRRLAPLATAFVLLASPARAALTGAAGLAAVYDSILGARFDAVDRQLEQACPPAPGEACAALRVVSMWWRILLDPESRLLDGHLTDLADTAIAANEAWTKREPARAEAWFYLAGSYAPLVQWRVLRGETLAAARDGKKIKDALERALRLDPALDDAYFGIGLYHYYADVAPTTAKIVRWLLFLPGGDRVKGLREMRQARQRGALVRGEADYQLHLIYLWYEHDTPRALQLLEDLDKQFPANPVFLERQAVVYDEWLHDHPASASAWQTLLDRARAGRVGHQAVVETRARVGLATQLDDVYETDRAIEQLRAVVDISPRVGSRAAHSRAWLQLGLFYDRMGQREQAIDAYTTALDQAPRDDSATRARSRAGLRETPDRTARVAYRLSLEGWRAFERGALDPAAAALQRAIALGPADEVARYRYARVLAARGDTMQARAALEIVIAAPSAPPIALAGALVEYAHLLERAGDRGRAIEMYRRGEQIVGSHTRTRDDARAALKRLGAS